MTRGFPEPGDFDQRDAIEQHDDTIAERERLDRFSPTDWRQHVEKRKTTPTPEGSGMDETDGATGST